MDGNDALDQGRRFVDALTSHDWEGLAACFAEGARFRAVVPNSEHPFRDGTGGADAAAQLRRWFGDADVTELVASTVEMVGDRLHVAYRIREHESDGWFLVEQQAFITPSPAGIAYLNLVCSGFRPLES